MMCASRVRIHPEAFSKDSSRRRRRPRQVAVNYLEWIRTLPCVITGKTPVEAAHVRFADPRFAKRSTGLGERPDDKWALPLSADKHRLADDAQHKGNERAFWRDHGVDPCLVAAALWANSGDDEAAELILREAREWRS